MENYTNHGTAPSTLSYLPTATSLTGAMVTGGLRRRVAGDVCLGAGSRNAFQVQGIALPVVPAVNGFDVTPMADVQFVKSRSGSHAFELTG